MIKRIYLILLLTAVMLSCMAQTIGETFCIYRNDGQFNAFFRDEVISIDYSYEDADGNTYDEIVTQIVNTADSVYMIPLAAIDSVGFVTPDNVYKPGVIKLEGEIRSYIVSSDSLTIYFKSDTPNTILPKINDYLFTEEVSDVFYNGFIGKVESVKEENGLIVVVCSQADFEEVFEYYFYITDIKNDVNRVRSFRNAAVDERTWERTWSPGPIDFDFTNYITPYIYRDPLGDLAFKVSNQQNVRVTPTFSVKFVRIVTPSRGTEVSLDITETDVIEENFAVSGSIKWENDIISTRDVPILETPIPFLMLYGKMGIFFSAEATVSGEQHFNQTYRYTFHCEGCSRSLLGTRVSINATEPESTRSGEILANGKVDLGLFGEIGVAFVASKIASVAYRGEVGIGLEGNTMLYKKEAENALHSTDVYKTLQGNDIKFKGFARTSLPVKLLWFGWPNEQIKKEKVFARISLVPNFSDTKLERDEEDNSTLFASTKVSGACFPVDLGFTLFEQQTTNGTTSYAHTGYIGTSTDLYSSFFNQSKSKKYEVYPTVKFLGIEMLAEPKAEERAEHSCPNSNHPHWIDLGLPSGTQWRCCNEGASTPEAYGGYYTFGQVSSAPSVEQIKELLNNCAYQWTTKNGVKGGKFTGPNGGTIFLPAAGYHWGGEFYRVGSYGYYWSSTPYGEYLACGLYFLSNYTDWRHYGRLRSYGYEPSVRPVR